MESIIRTAVPHLRPATQEFSRIAQGAGTFGSAACTELFGLRVLARYATSATSVGPVEAVMREEPDASVVNLFQMISMLSIRPEFLTRLTFTNRTAGSTDSQTTTAPSALQSAAAAQATAARALAAANGSAAATRTLLERVFARACRIEHPGSAAGPHRFPAASSSSVYQATPPDPPSADAPHAIDLIVRKIGARQQPDQVDPPSRTSVMTTPSPEHRAAPATAARTALAAASVDALSPADVGRLTDEVVRAIDRRIIAQRERKGLF